MKSNLKLNKYLRMRLKKKITRTNKKRRVNLGKEKN